MVLVVSGVAQCVERRVVHTISQRTEVFRETTLDRGRPLCMDVAMYEGMSSAIF